MRSKKFRLGMGTATGVLAAALVFSSCVGGVQSTVDGLTKTAFVEGFIEYPGPDKRWAGPKSLMVHVSAKENWAQIEVVPPPKVFPDALTVNGRTLASAPTTGMSGEAAREQLAHLASVLQENEGSFAGCLLAVRVRLVRNDGSVVEKSGCRVQSAWSRTISEAASQFVTASLYGTPESRASERATAPAIRSESDVQAKARDSAPARVPANAEPASSQAKSPSSI